MGTGWRTWWGRSRRFRQMRPGAGGPRRQRQVTGAALLQALSRRAAVLRTRGRRAGRHAGAWLPSTTSSAALQGAERCSETQPSGAEVPGRRRGPQGKNQVEVGQWPSLLLKHTSWVADATPHPIPCLRRRPLFIERAPWAGPPRRPPRGPPRYVDVAEIGHSMPPPHLPRQDDARVSASRPKPHQSMRWYRRNDTP